MTKLSFKKLFLTALFVFIFCISIGYSQDNTKQLDNESGIEVSIRFYDKKIYHLDEPIIVEFQIVNNRRDDYLFVTSYKKIFTFDFDIYSMTKKKVFHSPDYIIDSKKFEPVFNDKVVLKHFEVYGVRIDISEWFKFEEPGEYVIRGKFYPDLITNSDNVEVTENELFLNLNPRYTEIDREQERKEEISRLKTDNFPPYDVVKLMLEALMEGDFEKYFLFIKWEKFVLQFDTAEKKYQGTKDIKKPSVIEELKDYIKGENTLEKMPYSDTIPINFDIIKTIIEKSDARVTVDETFKYENLVQKKRYTYHLHLYGDKWLLDKYGVENMSK